MAKLLALKPSLGTKGIDKQGGKGPTPFFRMDTQSRANGPHDDHSGGEIKLKSTLADKLVSSNIIKMKTATPCVGMSKNPKSLEKWDRKKKDSERLENLHFERIGQKLDKILENTRTARTVPKAVQMSLAEAMDSFQQASKARADRIEANIQWTRLLKEGRQTTEYMGGNIETNTTKQDEVLKEIKKINSTLTDQDQKIKSLADNITTRLEHFPPTRHETIDVGGSDNTDNVPWVEVVKKKPKPAPAIVRQKAPAVMVKTRDLSYIEALQKIRKEPSLRDLAKGIISLRKTEAGHLLVEIDRGS